MAKPNLDKMSVEELQALKTDIEQTIRQRRETERTTLMEEMAKMASDAGFSIDDLYGKAKNKKTTLPPKYRNPDNHSQTWIGRGKHPNWMKELLEKGHEKDEFLIK